MKTFKKVGNIVLDVFVVLIFIIAVGIIISNVSANNKNKQANLFGYVTYSVQRDSMSGTFEIGDMVIGKIYDGKSGIEENDIVSFYIIVGDQKVVDTHRVVRKYEYNGVTYYKTQGDNREACPEPDYPDKTDADIISVYKTHIDNLGGIIDGLKKPVWFIIFIVTPLLAIIGIQVYKLIDIYLKSKKEKMAEEIASGTSEDVKDAIIREYLEKQKMLEQENNKEEKNEIENKVED